MRYSDSFVREALGIDGKADIGFDAVGTDTRSLTPGMLFVALRGERFDAHDYLAEAAAAGVRGAVVRSGTPEIAGMVMYHVDDTLHALGELARAVRSRFRGPVIAITGQNGKTSTKEMVAAVLSTRWRTHRTHANLNNLIGVPLTVLQAADDAEALVVEAGANQPGEIPRYRDILTPDIAIVTSAGHGHLEGFGSVAGVVREKLALTVDAPLAVVGLDPPDLLAGATTRARRVITAGVDAVATVHPESVQISGDGRPVVSIDGTSFTLAARGRHQAGNAMFAWAVVRHFGLDAAAAAAALERFELPGGRGEMQHHGGLTILNDSYNANPQSFASVIALARELRTGRKLVFVAGTMRELGSHSAGLHADVASQLADLDPELLALVGDFVPAFAPFRDRFAGRLLEAATADEIGPQLASRLAGDEVIVLKGSRGVTLERILPAILNPGER